jgi:uncharacterized cupredoxin-like copper-binding protein
MTRLQQSVLIASVACAIAASPASVAAPSTTVNVTLKEWGLNTSASSVPAGDVTFNITNNGKDDHEIAIVKLKPGADPGKLPLAKNGSVDEDNIARAGEIVGEAEDIAPTTNKTLKLALQPGRYVIMCNMVENEDDGTIEAHFDKGMKTLLTVK